MICTLNIVVSIYIGKRADLERSQKLVQILLVWLIPVIASISLWAINRNFDDFHKVKSINKVGDAEDTIGASSHHINDSSSSSHSGD